MATVTVDAKGRTSLPRELRKQLPPEAGGLVVVSYFAEETLALRPIGEWKRYVREVLEPMANRDRRSARFVTLVTSTARQSELDGQNRLSLSPELMRRARLNREVTFAGDGARIRLWNPEKYRELLRMPDEDGEGFDDLFYSTGGGA